MTFGVILASTGMIQLKKLLALNYIFILIGSLVILCGFLAAFGIREMKGKGRGESHQRPSVSQNVKSLLVCVREERGIALAFLGNFANKMASIASYTYGTLLIQDSFPASEQDQAGDAISIIIMLSNILVIPLSLANGYLLDRVPRWKVLLGNSLAVILSLALMILAGRTHVFLFLGVFGLMCFNITSYLVVRSFVHFK